MSGALPAAAPHPPKKEATNRAARKVAAGVPLDTAIPTKPEVSHHGLPAWPHNAKSAPGDKLVL